jgi:hypothetical protein
MKAYLLLFAIILASVAARAQVAQKINYQAVIRNSTGAIIANQNVGIRFTIRDGAASGPAQYSEKHTVTTNAYGLVNLQIGGGTVISGTFASITWHTGSKFLQVEVDVTGGTSFTSLATVELISVPYALQADKAINFTGNLAGEVSGAQNATVIGNNTITNAKIADNAVNSAKIADNAISTAKVADNNIITSKIADNSITTVKIADNNITDSKIADNAITTNKLADNSVTSSKIAAGQLVKSINGVKDDVIITASGGTSLGVSGNTIMIVGGGGTSGTVTLSTAFGGNGVQNLSSRSDHNHVGQTWTATTGTGLTLYDNDAGGIGLNVYSYGTSYNAAAISGQVLSATGQSVGIFGATNSNDAYGAGVFGQATRAGSAKGIWGYAPGSNTYAIFGDGAGTGSYAGYFQGRVHVNGLLSKSAGSFKIDHPLDPANKYLSHSFVESPDMMNVYNGNAVLDANGEATIILPDYFEALNKDFRYQLTAIGKPSPNVYVASEISNNRFRIAGGAPGGKISWQVTGCRHDTYANEHPIPVEELKPAIERGKYLYRTAQQPQGPRTMVPPSADKQ